MLSWLSKHSSSDFETNIINEMWESFKIGASLKCLRFWNNSNLWTGYIYMLGWTVYWGRFSKVGCSSCANSLLFPSKMLLPHSQTYFWKILVLNFDTRLVISEEGQINYTSCCAQLGLFFFINLKKNER